MKREKRDIFQLIMADYGVEVIREHKFHEVRKWRFDYAIPSEKLAIEVEGGVWDYGRHNRADGFLKDMEKYNAAAEDGWRLLRYTPTDLCKTKTINQILNALKNGK